MANYALIKNGKVAYKIVSEYPYAHKYIVDGRADQIVELKDDEIIKIYVGYIYNSDTKRFIPNYENLSLSEAKRLKNEEIAKETEIALEGPCKTTIKDIFDDTFVTVDMNSVDLTMWQDGLWVGIYTAVQSTPELFNPTQEEMLQLSLKQIPVRLFAIACNYEFKMEIRDYYNKKRLLTIKQVHDIALQQGMGHMIIWKKKWDLQAEVEKCKNISEVMRINW